MLKGWAKFFKFKDVDKDSIKKLKNKDSEGYVDFLELLAEGSINVGERLGIIGQNLNFVGPQITMNPPEQEGEM